MIVTEAGVDPKVASLVYVAARAPDAGEDYTALAKQYPTPPATAGIVWNGAYGQLSEEALTTAKTQHAAWRSKPSWYAVSTEDRTFNPNLERFMAKRMGEGIEFCFIGVHPGQSGTFSAGTPASVSSARYNHLAGITHLFVV